MPKTKFSIDMEAEITVPECSIAATNDPFTAKEIATAVLQLNNNKSPGPDGLPIEFYKTFWKHVCKPMQNLIRTIFFTGQVNRSSAEGIINLIPKQGRDTRKLNNLRPITLLNSDYKVIEKLLANRMVPALDLLIDPDQKGFLPGRKINC